MTEREQELEKELFHKTEELNQIKEILALFLDKVYEEVDNIVPEDLEFRLRDDEMEKYQRVFLSIHKGEEKLHSSWIYEIECLCRELGWVEFSGYSSLHNIKMFIKSLARENFTLKKMVGAKQTNGDPRTNNLGSSDTSTN
jgi:hypothetical protein